MSNIKETDLFPPVKKWLEDKGFKVYSEVSPKRCNARADIVAIQDKITVVVELKTSLNLDLMEQCVAWKHRAHYIYAAVPKPKEFNQYSLSLLRQEGIGLLPVEFNYNGVGWCKESALIVPKLHRKISPILYDWLGKHQEQYEKSEVQGGNYGGGYLTPYTLTINKVKDFLISWSNSGKWISMDAILKHCETHYSTPRPSLNKALREYEKEWCETSVIKGKLHFRIKKVVK